MLFRFNFSGIRITSVLFLAMFASSLSAECKTPFTEEQKIESLIIAVQKLDGVFIRNGEEHGAKKASEHLRYKLDSAKKSFFAPDPKDWTAKLFIEKVASKSFLSGEVYRIKWKDGKTLTSQAWLEAELKKINESCR
ncbi:DUF5329 family protein [Leptospira ilyithenensis]|uniref:Uncharacterized protein n=1 Tax=Leptospira ilyithenensis TaxID=2484901 RepID=A0A4V3JX78_9LEPT|nr:DUF5329 family protein [Leptospira ilyithenensis]TGN08723.1 hypothetical protein EHS11_13170 [Leptospira ilyithenensis]